MRRVFDNPNNLVEYIILYRLVMSDSQVRVDPYQVEDPDTEAITYYVGIESTLADDVIETALVAPASQVELDAYAAFVGSGDRVSAIPGWATWTEAQVQEWWVVNFSDAVVDAITDLPSAKEMMKQQNHAIQSMARILLALRDKTWPNL